ncbi:MAG TPA: tetratricopeptide repeat protein [Acidobacteriaceae bacterium]|jgi:cytochrome c-type biogenesis protein CcmH/NrfG|nr:tetratricopeptide repeat protein [Acidobacteriaceae bacterium]
MSSKAAFLLVCWVAVGIPWSQSQTPPATKDQIETHSRRAHEYLAQQRPDLAIPELRTVVALDPNDLDARVNLGVLLFFRGDYAGAVPQLRAAVAIKPDLWKQKALLGLAEGRLHDPGSQADLEAAFPHLTEEKFQREVGQVLIDQYTAGGDLDKAAMVVSELLATRPMDTGLLYLSYRLYSDLAGRSMLTLALTAPDSGEMHQVMARELARHGDNASAIANYREAIRIDPRLAGLHSELADLLYHSDDDKLKAEAPAEFQAAVAENPNDEQAILSLGMIAAENSDLKTAYADDSRAVELDPNDSDACTELAKVLVLMNEPDKAEQMLERAVQADPSNYVAHYRLAGLYRQHGKIDLATKQVAEYQKYKQMKDKLQKVFEDMRVAAARRLADEGTGSAH